MIIVVAGMYELIVQVVFYPVRFFVCFCFIFVSQGLHRLVLHAHRPNPFGQCPIATHTVFGRYTLKICPAQQAVVSRALYDPAERMGLFSFFRQLFMFSFFFLIYLGLNGSHISGEEEKTFVNG